MTYVIGIDGGGTKTQAILADQNGHVIVNITVGPTNPNTISKEKLRITFQLVFNQFKDLAPYAFKNVTSIFAGISGAANKESKKLLYQIISSYLPTGITIRVEPDAINALYSGTFGEPGIVQICGTGSITYGINQDSIHDRVGGWGYLLGDEGSGYDIGRLGVIAALKFHDGRGQRTILLQRLYDFYQVENGRDLIEKVYQSHSPKHEISSVSKIVFQAVRDGDAVAKEIINKISKEICISIVTLYDKLFEANDNVKVILCGGIFSDQTILLPLIRKDIKEYDKNVTIVVPKLPPVGGSIIGACLSNKLDSHSTIIENLVNELK